MNQDILVAIVATCILCVDGLQTRHLTYQLSNLAQTNRMFSAQLRQWESAAMTVPNFRMDLYQKGLEMKLSKPEAIQYANNPTNFSRGN
jgi:hypothetical protein